MGSEMCIRDRATKQSPELVQALLVSARFNEVRRDMNMEYIQLLKQGLPDVPVVTVPLFEQDVQGLRRLHDYQEALFDPANRV